MTQSTPISVPLGFLIGDATGDKNTNSADVSQVKSVSGATVSAVIFRNDVDHDGTLNSADVSFVKSKSGHSIP